MAALFLLLAVLGAIVVGDLVFENTAVGAITVLNHPITGYSDGALLAMAAGLGFLVGLQEPIEVDAADAFGLAASVDGQPVVLIIGNNEMTRVQRHRRGGISQALVARLCCGRAYRTQQQRSQRAHQAANGAVRSSSQARAAPLTFGLRRSRTVAW